MQPQQDFPNVEQDLELDDLQGTGLGQAGDGLIFLAIQESPAQVYDEATKKMKSTPVKERRAWLARKVSSDKIETFANITGKIVELRAEARPEKPENRIPAHIEYKIIMKAKDTDGAIKKFSIGFHSHWKSPIISDLLNQLAGLLENPMWNQIAKVSVYMKANQDLTAATKRCMLYVGNEKAPYKFPWNDDNKRYDGVPEPERDAQGNPDFASIFAFWHGVAEECAAKLGTPFTALPVQASPTYNPGMAPTGQQRPAAPPAVPGTKPAGNKPVNEAAMAWLREQWSKTAGDKQDAGRLHFLAKTAFGVQTVKNLPATDPLRKVLAEDIRNFGIELGLITASDGQYDPNDGGWLESDAPF